MTVEEVRRMIIERYIRHMATRCDIYNRVEYQIEMCGAEEDRNILKYVFGMKDETIDDIYGMNGGRE